MERYRNKEWTWEVYDRTCMPVHWDSFELFNKSSMCLWCQFFWKKNKSPFSLLFRQPSPSVTFLNKWSKWDEVKRKCSPKTVSVALYLVWLRAIASVRSVNTDWNVLELLFICIIQFSIIFFFVTMHFDHSRHSTSFSNICAAALFNILTERRNWFV